MRLDEREAAQGRLFYGWRRVERATAKAARAKALWRKGGWGLGFRRARAWL